METTNASKLFAAGDDIKKDITVDMLDYQYIDKCKNVKELERIFRILASGKEGYYPHLVMHCENRIKHLNPTSKALRKENKKTQIRDLPKEEAADVVNGILEWNNKMKEVEPQVNGHHGDDTLPPIRNASSIIGKKSEEVKQNKPARIRSGDYAAWDKLNVDEECAKVDEEKPVVTSSHQVKIATEIDSTKMDEYEKVVRAAKEKDKGNEAFKAGDFEEALAYYSRSVSLCRTAASINNRALAYLRLSSWQLAIDDCNEVLSFEAGNLKAMLRRASAHKELGKLNEARSDLQFVLHKEPNNTRALKMLEEIEATKRKRGRKMMIEEESDEDEEIRSDVKEGSATTRDEKKIVSPDDNSKPVSVEEAVTPSSSTTSQPTTVTSPPPPSSPCIATVTSSLLTITSSSPKTQATTSPPMATSSPPAVVSAVVSSPPTATSSPPTATSSPPTVTSSPPTVTSSPPTATSSPHLSFPPKAAEKIELPMPEDVQAIKLEAGNLFRSGSYGEAIIKYSNAIQLLQAQQQAAISPQISYDHVTSVLYGNRALCRLKLGDLHACISDCNHVIELKGRDVKALMRRGAAYEALEKYDRAYVDFHTAYQTDVNAKQAQDGANRMAKLLREEHGRDWRNCLPAPITGGDGPSIMFPVTKPPPHVTADSKTKPLAETDLKNRSNKSSNVSVDKKPSVTVKSAAEVKPTKKATAKDVKTDKKPTTKAAANTKKTTTGKDAKKPPESNASPMKLPPSAAREAAKRDQIRHNLYEKLKKDGNAMVARGNYQVAIQSYSKCIEIAPDQVASYTNRALCHLKLAAYTDAEVDCSLALDRDPDNVKAYFRRAQARHKLGKLPAAERDLRALLALDRDNKAAHVELRQVRTEIAKLASRDADDVTTGKKKKVVIKEVDESSDEELPAVQPSKIVELPDKESSNIIPVKPSKTTKPSEPPKTTRPSEPSKTTKPSEPSKTTKPSEPSKATRPSEPSKATRPSEPSKATRPSEPSKSTKPSEPIMSPKATKLSSEPSKSMELPNDKPSKITEISGEPSKSTKPSESSKPSAPSKTNRLSAEPAEIALPPSDEPFEIIEVPEEPSKTAIAQSQPSKSTNPIPPSASLSPYEFGHRWNTVQARDDPLQYKQILDLVEVEKIPDVVSNKIDDHMITTFAKVARLHVTAGEHERAYQLLARLRYARRFDMAAMFLSKRDRQLVASTVDLLDRCGADLGVLRAAYTV